MPNYFVRTLLTIIHAILPLLKRKPKKKEGVDKAKYSALAIADSKETHSNRKENGDNVDHRRGDSDKPELYKVYKGMSFAEEVGNEAVDCFRRLLYQEEEGVEVEIEMNEDEPAFLQGQSRHSMDMSPETGERHLAHELRGFCLSSTYDTPKWKKNAYGH